MLKLSAIGINVMRRSECTFGRCLIFLFPGKHQAPRLSRTFRGDLKLYHIVFVDDI